MSSIAAIHSFRGGTGKSNTAANAAACLAMAGKAVGIVDVDVQSPGIHTLFGLDQSTLSYSLNDYLWGACDIKQAAHDVTAGAGAVEGRVYLVPASVRAGDIARIMRDGYDVESLNDGFRRLVHELALDLLILDTHPGINEETLLSIAMSNTLAIVMRPDQQDYEGTSVTLAVARKLGVPKTFIVVNKTPAVFDVAEVRARVETTYECDVAAVFPHSDELMTLSSGAIFATRYPDDPITGMYREVANELLG